MTTTQSSRSKLQGVGGTRGSESGATSSRFRKNSFKPSDSLHQKKETPCPATGIWRELPGLRTEWEEVARHRILLKVQESRKKSCDTVSFLKVQESRKKSCATVSFKRHSVTTQLRSLRVDPCLNRFVALLAQRLHQVLLRWDVGIILSVNVVVEYPALLSSRTRVQQVPGAPIIVLQEE
jgi:hypothetical protein